MVSRMMSEATWVERARILAFFVLALLIAVLVGLLLATEPAHAATFTVNSTADTGDASPDGACDSCTLREAIQEANNATTSPGADTINFAIPGAGPHTISPASELPLITETLTIDGYTESLGEGTNRASENTLPVGNNAVLKIELRGAGTGNGLKIEADNSTIKGLIINKWENGVFLDLTASANKVQGNYIGTDVTGTTDKNGAVELGNNIGVVDSGANNTIGGTSATARNIISGNDGFGVQINNGGTNNKVQGNYIGTNKTGTSALGNNYGVVIESSPSNTIGGTTAAERNIISGNTENGILLRFTGANDNKVQGNFIGTNASGIPVFDPTTNNSLLGNGSHGVFIQVDADHNTIGGTTAAARNIISGNGGDGVQIFFDSENDKDPPITGQPIIPTGNSILSNSIYGNDELGIDLVHSNNLNEEVSPNDLGDGDLGPNNLQNYPEITTVKLIKKNRKKLTRIAGTLDSTANTSFTIQLFSNPDMDPSGNGEGKTLLAQLTNVNTDVNGDASFSKAVSRAKAPLGSNITATATDSSGNTSEFSKACTVPEVPCLP